jgi:hypothetical protein
MENFNKRNRYPKEEKKVRDTTTELSAEHKEEEE